MVVAASDGISGYTITLMLHIAGFITPGNFASAATNIISIALISQSYFSCFGIFRLGLTHFFGQRSIAKWRYISLFFDRRALREMPTSLINKRVSVITTRGDASIRVTDASGEFPVNAYRSETEESVEAALHDEEDREYNLSELSASWIKAEPQSTPSNDLSRSHFLGNFELTNGQKEFMLAQHTAVWLLGTLTQLLILCVTITLDYLYFRSFKYNSVIFLIIAVLLRIFSTLLILALWSSYLSYSLAFRGIFAFWMYYQIDNSSKKNRFGDVPVNIDSIKSSSYQTAEHSRLLRWTHRCIPILSPLFMCTAKPVARLMGLTLGGESYFCTFRMHDSNLTGDDMQWVTHHWVFSNCKTNFWRIRLPAKTLRGLQQTWGTEKAYSWYILAATVITVARSIFLTYTAPTSMESQWEKRKIWEAILLIVGALIQLVPTGPFTQLRALRQEWRADPQN